MRSKRYRSSRVVLDLSGNLSAETCEAFATTLRAAVETHPTEITVLLDSRGGDVVAVRQIQRALQWVATERDIGVVIAARNAYSAAAILLTGVDRAYLYHAATFGFHDIIWQSQLFALRREGAFAIGVRLDSANRSVVRRLASRVMGRIRQRLDLIAGRDREWRDGRDSVSSMVELMGRKLSSTVTYKAPCDAAATGAHFYAVIAPLVNPDVGRRTDSELFEAVFKGGIGPNGECSAITAAELAIKYAFVRDVFRAYCNRHPFHQAHRHLPLSMHCLAFALCGRLMVGENPISAVDAYWLGLVDSVFRDETLQQLLEVRQ